MTWVANHAGCNLQVVTDTNFSDTQILSVWNITLFLALVFRWQIISITYSVYNNSNIAYFVSTSIVTQNFSWIPNSNNTYHPVFYMLSLATIKWPIVSRAASLVWRLVTEGVVFVLWESSRLVLNAKKHLELHHGKFILH